MISGFWFWQWSNCILTGLLFLKYNIEDWLMPADCKPQLARCVLIHDNKTNMLNLLDTHPTFSFQSKATWNWQQSFQGFPSNWILTNVKITRLNLPAVNSFCVHMRNSWSKYAPNSATTSSILSTFLQKQKNLTMEVCPWQASVSSLSGGVRK